MRPTLELTKCFITRSPHTHGSRRSYGAIGGDVVDEDGNPIEQKKGGAAAENADDDLARAGMGGNDNKVTKYYYTV